MKVCEGCGAEPRRIESGPFAGSAGMHDYCVHCSKDLCGTCMKTGRCRDNETGKHETESDEDDEEDAAA